MSRLLDWLFGRKRNKEDRMPVSPPVEMPPPVELPPDRAVLVPDRVREASHDLANAVHASNAHRRSERRTLQERRLDPYGSWIDVNLKGLDLG